MRSIFTLDAIMDRRQSFTGLIRHLVTPTMEKLEMEVY